MGRGHGTGVPERSEFNRSCGLPPPHRLYLHDPYDRPRQWRKASPILPMASRAASRGRRVGAPEAQPGHAEEEAAVRPEPGLADDLPGRLPAGEPRNHEGRPAAGGTSPPDRPAGRWGGYPPRAQYEGAGAPPQGGPERPRLSVLRASLARSVPAMPERPDPARQPPLRSFKPTERRTTVPGRRNGRMRPGSGSDAVGRPWGRPADRAARPRRPPCIGSAFHGAPGGNPTRRTMKPPCRPTPPRGTAGDFLLAEDPCQARRSRPGESRSGSGVADGQGWALRRSEAIEAPPVDGLSALRGPA
jgi:hypothetical protein